MSHSYSVTQREELGAILDWHKNHYSFDHGPTNLISGPRWPPVCAGLSETGPRLTSCVTQSAVCLTIDLNCFTGTLCAISTLNYKLYNLTCDLLKPNHVLLMPDHKAENLATQQDIFKKKNPYLLVTYSSSSSSFCGGSGMAADWCFCTILIPPAFTATQA